ncbi:MAG: rod shape-determining protein MreD [Thiobacillaceae bacterium]|jgi:rod shape-determining protein MreD
MIGQTSVMPESQAGWGMILLTLLLALAMKLMPWSGSGLALRPDFLLVVLLIWAQKRPTLVGMALAWPLGLLADIQDGVVLGQHALGYVVGVFLVQYLQRRLMQFALPFQAMHIFVILLLVEVVTLVIGWTSGKTPQLGTILTAAPIGAVLWYLLAYLAKIPAAAKQRG